jgi:hypothetical protein
LKAGTIYGFNGELGNGRSTASLKGIFAKTRATPEYYGEKVGCASSSIVFALAKMGHYGKSFIKNISRIQGQKLWYQRAKKLQGDLGWNDEVLVSQIGDFVKEFPEYRVVVADLVLKSSSRSDWRGEKYVASGEIKIIFLNYSCTESHFSTISSIKEFVAQKGKNYKWCLDCSSYYLSTSSLRNCHCNLPDQVPKPRKQLTCQHCAHDYSQGSKHICYHSQCHSCTLSFKNGSRDMLNHRCPLFMSTTVKPGEFLGEGTSTLKGNSAQGQFALWVYDLESCIVAAEDTIPSYVVDEGY